MQTITSVLPHRPVMQMHLADLEQPAQLARVKTNIAPLVLAWFEGQKPGDEFHINELTRYVWRTAPHVAADSPRRVMAALKDDGRLNYELVNRAQSLYRVLAMEAACENCGKSEPSGLATCEGCGEKVCNQCATPGRSWGGVGGGNSSDFWCPCCLEAKEAA